MILVMGFRKEFGRLGSMIENEVMSEDRSMTIWIARDPRLEKLNNIWKHSGERLFYIS